MGPLEPDIYGVKCDARGCGWSDMTVPRSAYPAWRNAACPKCGANVFTDADWKTMRRIERIVWVINLLLFWKKRPAKTEAAFIAGFEFNGTGAVRTTLPVQALSGGGEAKPTSETDYNPLPAAPSHPAVKL